jgi:hypothetical protein
VQKRQQEHELKVAKEMAKAAEKEKAKGSLVNGLIGLGVKVVMDVIFKGGRR